jgi:hypothetical protein
MSGVQPVEEEELSEEEKNIFDPEVVKTLEEFIKSKSPKFNVRVAEVSKDCLESAIYSPTTQMGAKAREMQVWKNYNEGCLLRYRSIYLLWRNVKSKTLKNL